MASPRVRKIADRIKVVVAEMLERRVKDPRLGFVTVTDVRVTGDLQHADVFYTVLGDDMARAGSAKALESAKGLIRSEVGKQLGIPEHERKAPVTAHTSAGKPGTRKTRYGNAQKAKTARQQRRA